MKELCDKAEKMVRSGTVLLVLSDRNIAKIACRFRLRWRLAAIQTRLVEQSLRCDANIIVETASARDPHHFAVLLGFGATAIYPYLAYETLGRLVDTHAIAKDYRTVMLNYRNGINKGLYKIMSKMGISTIQSYQSAQIFECLGINRDVVDKYFTNTVSRVEASAWRRSRRAWSGTTTRPSTPGLGLMTPPGLHRHPSAALRPRQGGPHVQPPGHSAAAEGRPGGQL